MHCPRCQAEKPEQAKFCLNCGARLTLVCSECGTDGSGQTRLTDHSAVDYRSAWSPDGTRIAFISDRDGNREIYVMNANGSGMTNLTNDPGVDAELAWSPDGTTLAFSSNRSGNMEVYVMNADGSEVTNLTDDSARDFFPTWQP